MLCILLSAELFSKKIKKGYIFIILLSCTLLQTLKCYSGFRNYYIDDIKDNINYLNKVKIKSIFIDRKESYKIGLLDDSDSILIVNSQDIDEIQKKHSLHNQKIISNRIAIIYDQRRKKDSTPSGQLYSKFVTSKNKHHMNIWTQELQPLPTIASVENIHYNKKQSLIRNGDIETIDPSEKTKNRFESWIKAGVSFYDINSNKIPKSEVLLQSWAPLIGKKYPYVFADPMVPIDGSYSLHVIFRDRTTLYLLNWFKASSGIFSFIVKAIDGNTHFSIIRHEMNLERKTSIAQKDQFIIFINDSNLHYFETTIRKENSNSIMYLFVIEGSDSDFLIDNISFIPLQI